MENRPETAPSANFSTKKRWNDSIPSGLAGEGGAPKDAPAEETRVGENPQS